MKKAFKSSRGITLATLAIYVVGLLVVLGILATVTANYRRNLDRMR
jgi:hypothetical protein